jgi:hypothetical protein
VTMAPAKQKAGKAEADKGPRTPDKSTGGQQAKTGKTTGKGSR